MPKDYIPPSLEIWNALTAQKITFEVDEFAPRVYSNSFTGECYVDYKRRNTGGRPDKFEAPFFGPGGLDNTVKALRALERETGGILQYGGVDRSNDVCDVVRWAWIYYWSWKRVNANVIGKTDGIALFELLYKVVTK